MGLALGLIFAVMAGLRHRDLTSEGQRVDSSLLGTAISLVPERRPLLLAKTIASLDRVSQGRFVFGIGSGWLLRTITTLADGARSAVAADVDGDGYCLDQAGITEAIGRGRFGIAGP